VRGRAVRRRGAAAAAAPGERHGAGAGLEHFLHAGVLWDPLLARLGGGMALRVRSLLAGAALGALQAPHGAARPALAAFLFDSPAPHPRLPVAFLGILSPEAPSVPGPG